MNKKLDIKTVILRRYILIFTLALISCAGTNYIHSLSNDQASKDYNSEQFENQAVDDDLNKMKRVRLN